MALARGVPEHRARSLAVWEVLSYGWQWLLKRYVLASSEGSGNRCHIDPMALVVGKPEHSLNIQLTVSWSFSARWMSSQREHPKMLPSGESPRSRHAPSMVQRWSYLLQSAGNADNPNTDPVLRLWSLNDTSLSSSFGLNTPVSTLG